MIQCNIAAKMTNNKVIYAPINLKVLSPVGEAFGKVSVTSRFYFLFCFWSTRLNNLQN